MDLQRTILWWVQCKWLKTYGRHFLKISQRVVLSVCRKGGFIIKARLGIGKRKVFMEGQCILPSHCFWLIFMPQLSRMITQDDQHEAELSPFITLDLDHGRSSCPRSWNTDHRCQNWKDLRFPTKVSSPLVWGNWESERASDLSRSHSQYVAGLGHWFSYV